MNFFHPPYPGDAALLLAADVFVQIAGVAAVALAAGRTVARRNAAVRHAVCLGALVWVCLSPAAAWGLRRAGVTLWRVPVSVGEMRSAVKPQAAAGGFAPVAGAGGTAGFAVPSSGGTTDAPPADVSLLAASLPTQTDVAPLDGKPAPGVVARPPSPQPHRALETVAGVATLVWAAGAAILLARLAAGLVFVARVRRDLTPAEGVVSGDVLGRVRRTLGVAALPPIRLSRRLSGPAAVGLWRPVVVLPADLAAGMSGQELHDALAHECGHALRRDGAVAVLQRLAGAIFWPHPLLPPLNRALARAREEVCDNLVLRATPPAAYARTLLALAERSRAAGGGAIGVGLLDGSWRLEHRVAGLLHARRIVMTRINNRTNVMVAAMIGTVGAALAAVGTAAEPKETPAAPAKSDAPATQPAATTQPASAGKGSLDIKDVPYLEDNAASAAEAAAVLTAAGAANKPLAVRVGQPLTNPAALALFDRFAVHYVYTDFRGDDRIDRTRAVADQVIASTRSKGAFVLNFPYEKKPVTPKRPGAADRLLKPEEVEESQKKEGSRRDVRGAELDLQEATVKLQSDSITLSRLEAAAKSGQAGMDEVEKAKLAVELDRIRLERARLNLEGAKEKADRLLPPVEVYNLGWGRNYSRYLLGGRQLTVTQVLKQWPYTDMSHAGEIHVELMRESSTRYHVPLQDLVAGKIADDVVQPGDSIRVIPQSAVVEDMTREDLSTIWLRGRTLTFRQVLTEAGVDLATSKGKRIEISGIETNGRPNFSRGTYNLGDVLKGSLKNILDVSVRPGDSVKIQ